jgi:hypothetical protein
VENGFLSHTIYEIAGGKMFILLKIDNIDSIFFRRVSVLENYVPDNIKHKLKKDLLKQFKGGLISF